MDIEQQTVTRIEVLEKELSAVKADNKKLRNHLLSLGKELRDIRDAVRELEGEKTNLRSAVVVVWQKIVDMVNTMYDRIRVIEKRQQQTSSMLNSFIGHSRKPDTGFLSEQQAHRWIVRVSSLLVQHFNDLELDELIFDTISKPENIVGRSPAEKARYLVTYAHRRNILRDVVDVCRKERPLVNWPLDPIDVDLDMDINAEWDRLLNNKGDG